MGELDSGGTGEGGKTGSGQTLLHATAHHRNHPVHLHTPTRARCPFCLVEFLKGNGEEGPNRSPLGGGEGAAQMRETEYEGDVLGLVEGWDQGRVE